MTNQLPEGIAAYVCGITTLITAAEWNDKYEEAAAILIGFCKRACKQWKANGDSAFWRY